MGKLAPASVSSVGFPSRSCFRASTLTTEGPDSERWAAPPGSPPGRHPPANTSTETISSVCFSFLFFPPLRPQNLNPGAFFIGEVNIYSQGMRKVCAPPRPGLFWKHISSSTMWQRAHVSFRPSCMLLHVALLCFLMCCNRCLCCPAVMICHQKRSLI